jgi:hypothetical protein
LKVWDAQSFECIRTLQGHSNWVWDAESFECIQTLKGHTNTVIAVAVYGDGKRYVSGSWDKTLKVWDQKRVVSGSSDCTVKLWNHGTGDCEKTMKGHRGEVNAVVAKDGTVISGSDDREIKLWERSSAESNIGSSSSTADVDSRQGLPPLLLPKDQGKGGRGGGSRGRKKNRRKKKQHLAPSPAIVPGSVSSFTVYSEQDKRCMMVVLQLFVAERGGSLRVDELGQFYDAYPECKEIMQACNIKELFKDFPDQGLRFEESATPTNHRIVISEDTVGSSSSSDPGPKVTEAVGMRDFRDEENDCIVCMSAPRCQDIFLSPCRHRKCCRSCAEKFVSKPCPFCRTVVEEVLQLY